MKRPKYELSCVEKDHFKLSPHETFHMFICYNGSPLRPHTLFWIKCESDFEKITWAWITFCRSSNVYIRIKDTQRIFEVFVQIWRLISFKMVLKIRCLSFIDSTNSSSMTVFGISVRMLASNKIQWSTQGISPLIIWSTHYSISHLFFSSSSHYDVFSCSNSNSARRFHWSKQKTWHLLLNHTFFSWILSLAKSVWMDSPLQRRYHFSWTIRSFKVKKIRVSSLYIYFKSLTQCGPVGCQITQN